MGIGAFKKGKKTAKAIDNELNQFEVRVRNALIMVQSQLMQLGQSIQRAERHLEVVDYRSLATMKLLEAKNVFTTEEHLAVAELQRIEAFNEESSRDNQARHLEPAGDDAVVDEGIVYVARVDASEPATVTTKVDDVDTIQPNPDAGKKIDQLSMLRMKMKFGAGDFPKTFEDQLKGAKAGQILSFQLECPPEMGAFAGKVVDFKVAIVELLKDTTPATAVEVADESGSASLPSLTAGETPN